MIFVFRYMMELESQQKINREEESSLLTDRFNLQHILQEHQMDTVPLQQCEKPCHQ